LALFLGNIYHFLRAAANAAISRVCYYTHNLEVTAALPEFPSDRVSPLEIMPHKLFIHHRCPWSILVISFAEISPA